MNVEFNSLSLASYLEVFVLLTSRFSQTSGIKKFLTCFIFLIDMLILIVLAPILIILLPFKLLYTLLIDWANGSFMSYIIFIGLLWDLAILFVYNFIVWLLYKFIYFTSLSMGKTAMENMDKEFERSFKRAYGEIIEEENNTDPFYKYDAQNSSYNNLYIINSEENDEKN